MVTASILAVLLFVLNITVTSATPIVTSAVGGSACAPLHPPTNGVVQCTHTGNQLVCTAICSSGFIFATGERNVQHICADLSGIWNHGSTFPTCVVGNCDVDVVKYLADSQFSASSVFSGLNGYYFGPERSRIDAVAEGNSSMVYSGGWRSAVDELDQYVQVDLGRVTRITGVVTKGRDVITGDTANEYVKRFRILHSMDGLQWNPYSSRTVNDVFFIGDSDNVSPTTSFLSCPFDARYVRINPISWHEHIALRFALLGCESDRSKPPCESSTSTTMEVPTPPSSTSTTHRVPTTTTTRTTTTTTPPPTTTTVPTTSATTQKVTTMPTYTTTTKATTQAQKTPVTAPPSALGCYNLPPLTNGQLNCEQQFGSPDVLVCVGHCKQGYIFETNEMAIKKVCSVTTGQWSTAKTFPACIENHHSTPQPPIHNFTVGCVTTVHSCDHIGNGDFQACGGCHFFATCSEGFMFIRACPEHLLYDTSTQTCEYRSTTCSVNTDPIG